MKTAPAIWCQHGAVCSVQPGQASDVMTPDKQWPGLYGATHGEIGDKGVFFNLQESSSRKDYDMVNV